MLACDPTAEKENKEAKKGTTGIAVVSIGRLSSRYGKRDHSLMEGATLNSILNPRKLPFCLTLNVRLLSVRACSVGGMVSPKEVMGVSGGAGTSRVRGS